MPRCLKLYNCGHELNYFEGEADTFGNIVYTGVCRGTSKGGNKSEIANVMMIILCELIGCLKDWFSNFLLIFLFFSQVALN